MLFTVLGLIFTLSISLGIISFYYRFKDLKEFRDDRMVEAPGIRHLLDAIVPSEGTKEYLVYSDYIYILYNRSNIRDFFLLKIIILLITLVLSFTVVGTNMLKDFTEAFAVNEQLPVSVTYEEYSHLSSGITFQEASYQRDKETIEMNIKTYKGKESSYIENVNVEDSYLHLQVIKSRLDKVFGILDIITILIFIVVGWKSPDWILKFCYNLLEGNKLFEYDTLETNISIHAEKPVSEILDILKIESKYYKNILYEFYNIYENNSEIAYNLVEYRQEFPKDFKRLIRYLSMIDSQGPDYVRDIIDSNKKQTEEEIYNLLRRNTKKKLQKLQLICTGAFILAITRIIISLFSVVV